MSNKTYDRIKAIALFLVPITAFASSVCNICHVPYAEIITGVLTALDTCLGSIVVVANKLYKGEKEAEDE